MNDSDIDTRSNTTRSNNNGKGCKMTKNLARNSAKGKGKGNIKQEDKYNNSHHKEQYNFY